MRESHGSDPRRSILHHSGKTALQASVFTSADFDVKDRHEFLFRTRDAVKLATAVEFYIEKFMSIMHLYLEGSGDAGDSAAMGMGASEMATNNLLGEDDMLALGGANPAWEIRRGPGADGGAPRRRGRRRPDERRHRGPPAFRPGSSAAAPDAGHPRPLHRAVAADQQRRGPVRTGRHHAAAARAPRRLGGRRFRILDGEK